MSAFSASMSAATSPIVTGLRLLGLLMQEVGQQEVGQGYWNMCITKEAVIGLQPGVVEGWVMGPMGIVSIVPKMATRGRRRCFGHSGTTYSVSKCSKSLPRVSSSCSSNFRPKFQLDQKLWQFY